MDETAGFSRLHLPKDEIILGIGISLILHVLLVFVVLVLPQVLPRRTYEIPFYTVKLITPEEAGLTSEAAAPTGPPPAVSPPAKRSQKSLFKPPPVVPVKRLAEAFRPMEPQVRKLDAETAPELPSMERPSIEESVDRLIPKKKARRVPRSKAPTAVSGPSGPAKETSAEDEDIGLARRLYYTEVWSAIKSQWVLPRSLIGAQKGLEAIVVIVVRRDGKIENIRFEKKSGNPVFDESVLRAIQKANPLPKFPDIYSPPRDEIGIRFRPEDLL